MTLPSHRGMQSLESSTSLRTTSMNPTPSTSTMRRFIIKLRIFITSKNTLAGGKSLHVHKAFSRVVQKTRSRMETIATGSVRKALLVMDQFATKIVTILAV